MDMLTIKSNMACTYRDKLYLDHRDVRMHLVALGFVFAVGGPDGISLEKEKGTGVSVELRRSQADC